MISKPQDLRLVLGGKMATYRVYRLDGMGKVNAAEWIEAESDEEALRIASEHDYCPPCEIWERDRFIGKVGREAG